MALQEAVFRGYANTAAVARMIKPEVQELVGYRVKMHSLITTIKRLKLAKTIGSKAMMVISKSSLDVRTNVSKTVLARAASSIRVVESIAHKGVDDFVEIVLGSDTITLIYDSSSQGKLEPLISGADIQKIESSAGLAAVSVRSPVEIEHTPGCVMMIYNGVSRRGINIEETISCGTETMLVVKDKLVGETVDALKELIKTCRREVRIARGGTR